MEQNKTDLVMKFVLGGKPVLSESNLDIRSDDTMMSEFKTGINYDYYSNFFEISEFEMGMSLKEDDESGNGANPNTRHPSHQTKVPASGGLYARWRSATQDEYKKVPFRLEFDRFTFKRVIDSASPIFFKACCMSQTFDSATLVKRVSQGDQKDSQTTAVGYLKVHFKKVLIVGVNWDDGDVVMEHCEFICQDFTVTYRPQLWKGNLGGELTAHWSKELELTSRGGGSRGN